MEQKSIKQFLALKYHQIKILKKDENKEISLVENKDIKERVIIKEINLSCLNEKEKKEHYKKE